MNERKKTSDQLREAAERNIALMDQLRREEETHLQEKIFIERQHRQDFDEVHMKYINLRNDITMKETALEALRRKADRMEAKLHAMKTAGAVGLLIFTGTAIATSCMAAEGFCSWLMPLAMLAASGWIAMMGGWCN